MNEIEKSIVQHDEQIKNLLKKVDDLTKLTESTNSLAVAVKELAIKQNQQDTRITTLEENTQFKMRTVWSCLASALIGAVISLVLTKIGG